MSSIFIFSFLSIIIFDCSILFEGTVALYVLKMT